MKTVKEIFDALPVQQQRKLLHAFELGIAQHVELPNKMFIGVNIRGANQGLRVLQVAGRWTVGVVK